MIMILPNRHQSSFTRLAICGLILSGATLHDWIMPQGDLAAQQPGSYIKVTVSGKRITGQLLASDSTSFALLQTDGRMQHLQHAEVKEMSEISGTFRPMSPSSLKDRMLKLAPKGYEVTNTGNFVVVHPVGTADQWAYPFEKLLGRFNSYFSVRDFNLNRPQFPLVVVVYATRSEFLRVAQKRDVANADNMAGFYSPTTNQVITYVQAQGLDKEWNSNHLTLVHEALHQFAFNSGIHNRWGVTPKWASEGLAVMFEAKGVNDSRTYTQRQHRIHQVYLAQFKNYVKAERHKGLLQQLVESDRYFEKDPHLAYTISWSVMFYLAENQRRELSSYLKTVAQLPNFTQYSPADRLQHFANHFGSDFNILEHRIVRFLEGL
ncbi:MAG TPA: DUF1570 domain-containing protein [Pirellulaceae bacterium]|nr:DUF1570 domain-containing protein [Pirellulaceae bacterium]HMP69985.1 DUF1570 domain-containing protein [Pirellulaceae bacterium]